MDTIQSKGNWNEQKGRLKQAIATLTGNDLLFAEGKTDEMFGKLQVMLSTAKAGMAKISRAV